MTTESNLQTEWAAVLFASLADAGVRDIVISPGSRSTPFVVAAVREPRLRKHDIIDERSAAFFALGQARVTGVPSVLVCTSGTAAAHYLPAIIEAELTGIPLIALTADRPHELYECRAPQTIDQVKLFGDHVRRFLELVPDSSTESLRALRRMVAQSVSESVWPKAGAVHLNARARKPLEPVAPTRDDEHDLVTRAQAVRAGAITSARRPVVHPNAETIADAAAIVRGARRGIIVVGPLPLARRDLRAAVAALARATGFSVAAETTSQVRIGPKQPGGEILDAFELLLRSATFRREAAFDCAIQIGPPPTSGSWEGIARGPLPRIVLTDHGWADPHANAASMVFGDLAASCEALAAAVGNPPSGPEVLARASWVAAASSAAWTAAEQVLAEGTELVEAVAVRALVDTTPEDALLVIGNSLAVRIVDIYTRASEREVGVLSQRGASGIDGLVAGAVGSAMASGRPTALLLGDVSLLHDIGSLQLAARVTTPLVVFVLHNGGGRIFEMLPIVDVPGIEREVIDRTTTPHQVSFEHAAALFQLAYTRVADEASVRTALAQAWSRPGATLIEVTVAPSGAITTSRSVAAAVERAIAKVSSARREP